MELVVKALWVIAFVVVCIAAIVVIVRFLSSQLFAWMLGNRAGPKFHIKKHLGVEASEMSILDVELAAAFYDDVGLTLARLQKQLGKKEPLLLVPPPNFVQRNMFGSWLNLTSLAQLTFFGKQPPAPARQVELEPGRFEIIREELYMWELDGVPVVVLAAVRGDYDSARALAQIGFPKGRGEDQAAKLAARLRDEIRRNNRYRGCLITLSQAGIGTAVQVLARPSAQAPILDDKVRAALDDAILSFMKNRDALKVAGIPTKRGVLLVGPPGTGKTSIARWLVSEVRDFTAILVQGDNPYALRQVFEMARNLAPSLVLLEDVDLIAGDRFNNAFAIFLGALLTEMDGVQDNEDVMVLMTTNEPEELEKALIRRPGRVDRVIEIGAPQRDLRVMLLEHFLQRAKLAVDVDLQAVANATDGLMPAALFELVKQAAVRAVVKGAVDEQGRPRITTSELIEAVPRLKAQTNPEKPRAGFA
jgi:hypothetical protein